MLRRDSGEVGNFSLVAMELVENTERTSLGMNRSVSVVRSTDYDDGSPVAAQNNSNVPISSTGSVAFPD
ncbi:MAG: hypothetical protein LC104_16050 [Bacteroidales bacterium]|nr:hypothetical protein [Bacteroidales bacterium]